MNNFNIVIVVCFSTYMMGVTSTRIIQRGVADPERMKELEVFKNRCHGPPIPSVDFNFLCKYFRNEKPRQRNANSWKQLEWSYRRRETPRPPSPMWYR